MPRLLTNLLGRWIIILWWNFLSGKETDGFVVVVLPRGVLTPYSIGTAAVCARTSQTKYFILDRTNRYCHRMSANHEGGNENDAVDEKDVIDTMKEETTDLNLRGFNPFNYATNRLSTKGISFSDATISAPVGGGVAGYSTRISLRATQMQELTQQLLNALGDEAQIRSILQENRTFLLEPLEEHDALLEPGSIYTSEMTREERYQAFQSAMDERVESSRNLHAQKVLIAMRDYVLECE